jgi:hypothetical protein
MQYYRPKHFELYELVPRVTYETLGEKAWLLLDPRTLISGDQVRDFFGVPCTANNWQAGDNKDSRGWRPGDDPDGAEHSQHKYGRALDLIIKGVSGAQARDVIMNHQEHFPFITRIEDGTPHLHFDCAPVFHRGIYLFQP